MLAFGGPWPGPGPEVAAVAARSRGARGVTQRR